MHSHQANTPSREKNRLFSQRVSNSAESCCRGLDQAKDRIYIYLYIYVILFLSSHTTKRESAYLVFLEKYAIVYCTGASSKKISVSSMIDEAPVQYTIAYFSRKTRYALSLLVVCDDRKRITYIYIYIYKYIRGPPPGCHLRRIYIYIYISVAPLLDVVSGEVFKRDV